MTHSVSADRSDLYDISGSPPMDSSLRGRVRNTTLAKSNGSAPLLEAVVNSIQAIHDFKVGSKVTVRYLYDENQKRLAEGGQRKVIGFSVEDDGPGFNQINLISFDTLDSDTKLEHGCKGIGRLLWLKAYDEVRIDSVFESEDGLREIAFRFDERCERYRDLPTEPSGGPRSTVVTLKGIRKEYRKSAVKKPDTLAELILNQCFTYFMNWEMPSIVIQSDEGTVDLNAMYEERRGKFDKRGFELDDERFEMTCIRFRKGKRNGSRVELCAGGRAVRAITIFKDLKLVDDESDFDYCVYLSSPYLDDTVNEDRSGFSIQEHLLNTDEICIDSIVAEVESRSREILGDALKKDLNVRTEKISGVVARNPELQLYKGLADGILDKVTSGMTDEQVYKAAGRWISDHEADLSFEVERAQTKRAIDPASQEDEILDKIDELYKGNLVRYIVHRRKIIDMLKSGMERYPVEDGQGNYPKEEFIHKVLLPKGTNPDNPAELKSCNLWMLDERMNYYAYEGAFSDVFMKRITGKDNRDRPDIVVLSEVVNDRAESVAIVELKRYGRKDDGTTTQMTRYVREMVDSGNILLRSGRKIVVDSNTMFYCYCLCDLNIKGFRENLMDDGYSRIYSGRGYYRWASSLNAHIEFIDYNQIGRDAEMRNDVFFRILGIESGKTD